MQLIELPSKDISLKLLLEADPCEESIKSYIDQSWCFAARVKDQIIAACIVKPLRNEVAEVFNVSVSPAYQQQGIGTALLRYALAELRDKGVKRVELATGTFGYQLTYYQRVGFRVDSVIKHHFIDNYPQPIYEAGIQHQDMLRLYINLN